jgi:hypothetical protein
MVAAAYARAPRFFRCAEVQMWIGKDPLLFVPLLRPRALLVDQTFASDGYVVDANAIYCPGVDHDFDATLRAWLLDT